MPNLIQLPEPCRVELRALYQQAELAKQTYAVASNAAMLALGVDLTLKVNLDLDTGVISIPEEGG